jgi:hypothetical protein
MPKVSPSPSAALLYKFMTPLLTLKQLGQSLLNLY